MPRLKQSQLEESMLIEGWGIMINSGVPIIHSLNVLRDSFPQYAKELVDVQDYIREGKSICDALEKHPRSFHPVFYALVDAGEIVGGLAEMLMKTADFIRTDINYGIDWREKVSSPELTKIMFYRCTATFIDAGIPLLKSLRVTEKMPALQSMQKPIAEICKEIEEGSTFSEAMDKQQKYFPALDVTLVKAGELGGALEVVMQRLADYAERRYFASLKSSIR
ncbi:MAG TPA: type II secretion system F family protein [Candidatus Nanoarchaeia archaeon]|nr:type II secretion system F family protein [Candidatus Nanoarchaeia archaeon]